MLLRVDFRAGNQVHETIVALFIEQHASEQAIRVRVVAPEPWTSAWQETIATKAVE